MTHEPPTLDRMEPSPTSTARRWPGLATAALCSVGAGTVHSAATGVHAEHAQLARIFVVVAAAQIGVGLWGVVRPSRSAGWAIAAVNSAAVGGWLLTRLVGIAWIDGLEVREAAQFADGACALLGATAAGAAVAAMLVGPRSAHAGRLALPSVAVAALAVPAMWMGGTHVHSAANATSDGHAHGVATTTAPGDPNGDSNAGPTTTTVDLSVWPRPWDPAVGIDLSGVPGVTPEQQARAEALIADTLRELRRWADPETAIADGYVSIGDARTGSEHFIKASLINDDVMLDPSQPESLVYTVVGERRILAGVMFIASPRPTDDPTLTDFAGGLMTWHNHGNLCWDLVDGRLSVIGVVDESTGTCARGINAGGEVPMVHVWITKHDCGPFAALEGQGAGQAAVAEEDRVDMCREHTH